MTGSFATGSGGTGREEPVTIATGSALWWF